ncbi:MAG: molybdopterin-dependent oxidoreductase [Pseudomonadota bacterium]
MSGEARSVRTTCPYCGVGCGLVATRGLDGSVEISGDALHPANFGRLCSKGSALGETLGADGRLVFPTVGGQRATWTHALDEVAARFTRIIDDHGPDALAFYVSGQLLTEDYYVANKLMKGYIGSANIDTNSRLCMASSVAGHRRAFGADTVPTVYADLDCTDLLILVGSNLAWCHPVLYQRVMAAKEARPTMRIVVIDPRHTATCEGADLHLPIRPDSDTALFTGLLRWLHENGGLDEAYLRTFTEGFDETFAQCMPMTVNAVAQSCGLSPECVRDFFELVESTPRTVTIYSQGVNQSVRGTDKVNAILNVHLATGRIGVPGAGPFSMTGQPNAMGGREVGGLANMLAAHMNLEDVSARDRVQRFWQSPAMATRPGLKAVELFDAVAAGDVKAVWIMATNPVDSMPRSDVVRAALDQCPLVVVSEIYSEVDTLDVADIVLPAAGWLEKDGTVTNSERRISRQRSLLPPPGEARPDWWIICEVARRMGFTDAFDFEGPAEIFAEHAALSAFENDGERDFDLSGLCALDAPAYDALQPVQWPVRAVNDFAEKRFFGRGRFFTSTGRAKAVPVAPIGPHRAETANDDGSLVLNTGRIRDQWHTMTRTGRSSRLCRHEPEPFIEIHPDDANRRGVAHGELVSVGADEREVILRARVTHAQLPGSTFSPMHWTDRLSSNGRINMLVQSDVDAVSGQPALKQSLGDVRPFLTTWHAYLLLNQSPDLAQLGAVARYWSIGRIPGGAQIELAGTTVRKPWELVFRALLGLPSHIDIVSVQDEVDAAYRAAAFDGDQLLGALFVARTQPGISRDWLAQQLAIDFGSAKDRLSLLAGRPRERRADPGRTICACMGVGINTIIAVARESATPTVALIGTRTGAGMGCGSCRHEIANLIEASHADAAE